MALWRSVTARGLSIAIASACELIQCAVHMHSIGVAGAEEVGCDIVNSTASGGEELFLFIFLMVLACVATENIRDILRALADGRRKEIISPMLMLSPLVSGLPASCRELL